MSLEEVVNQAKNTRHPWLMAGDANMCPGDFEKSPWFRRELMHVVVRKKLPHAGQNAQMVSGLKEHTIMSLRVTVSGRRIFTDEGGGRL